MSVRKAVAKLYCRKKRQVQKKVLVTSFKVVS